MMGRSTCGNKSTKVFTYQNILYHHTTLCPKPVRYMSPLVCKNTHVSCTSVLFLPLSSHFLPPTLSHITQSNPNPLVSVPMTDMFLPEDPSGTGHNAKAMKPKAGSNTMAASLTTILQPCLGVMEMMTMMPVLGRVPPPSSFVSSSKSSSSSAAAACKAGGTAAGGTERMTIISMVLVTGGDSGGGSDGGGPSPGPRVAMLTSCGRAMVVEIEGVCEAQGCVGVWAVLADWSAAEIQGPESAGVEGMRLPVFSLPRKDKGYSDQKQQQQLQQPPPLSLSPCTKRNSRRPPSSKPPKSHPNPNQPIAPKHQVLHIL